MNDLEIIEVLQHNDQQLQPPEEGQWLYEHQEPGQTLKQYQDVKPLSPNNKQNKIYLLPLGQFSSLQEKILDNTANYLQTFFGINTIVLSPISDDIIPRNFKRVREDGSIQLLAPYILDSVLKKKIPTDAIALMAITEKDLYPKASWGFVFGLATLKERVGVSSIYRYTKGPVDSLNYSRCLQRLIKTASHELGHMFTMRHCIRAVCVMNGSNSLRESDSRPNRLCSECLHKLYWNIGFDTRRRIMALDSFFFRHKLIEDHKVTRKDVALIE